jgi:hypothetical protein
MNQEQVSQEQFEEYKRYVVDETLYLTEKFRWIDRQYYRNQILYAKDEVELEHRVKQLNQRFDIAIHLQQLKDGFLKTLHVHPEEGTLADRLVYIVEQHAKLFCDQFGDTYAIIQETEHQEVHAVKSKRFIQWVTGIFFETYQTVPAIHTMSAALRVIAARARSHGETHALYNRVAWHQDMLYCDLTNEKWQAVKITKDGWEIVNDPPILFKRYAHQIPQILPTQNGDFTKLRQFLNIANEADRQLAEIYLLSNFVSDIPHPIPILYGPQGAFKSTFFRIIRKLCDPSIVELLPPPKDHSTYAQLCAHHWCVFLDNLSYLPEWLSDAICRTVTGEGFSKRELYTDDEDVLYQYQRCVGLNGINVVATKADVLDRSILLKFERINTRKRIPEKEFWQRFIEVRAEILGGIFDILSKAMQIKEILIIKEKPRMADFCEWGEAISQALGYTAGSFVRNYFANIGMQNSEAIEAHVIGPIIIAIAERGGFDGTPTELLAQVDIVAEELKMNSTAKSYPKSPNALSKRLNEIKSNLQDEGVTIISGSKRSPYRGVIRYITIQRSSTSYTSSTAIQAESGKEGRCNDVDAVDDTGLSYTHTEKVLSPRKLVLEYIKEHPFYNAEYIQKEFPQAVQSLLDEGMIIEQPDGMYGIVK